MDKNGYTRVNSNTWDEWAENGCEWSVPVNHAQVDAARAGEWGVYLTPCKFVPKEWFLPFAGARLLGLASGGGQQMPLFAVQGAECTVFDNSERQLESERMVAAREGYAIDIVKGDMSKPLPFADDSFDMIFHPVSNCYVEDVFHVWQECFRILRRGGVLLAGFDNGINYLFEDDAPLLAVNRLPYNPLNLSEADYARIANSGYGIQFSHTMEEQIGGQLKAGFRLTDLYEDRDREGGSEIGKYIPQYGATRAVKE